MFLRTDRLFLRPPFPEDWREVYEGINDAGIVRMLARAPWPYREEDARTYCSTVPEPRNVRMAIALPGADGAPLIGQVGVDCTQDLPEVGYWIARDHRGKGYATEAVRGILQLARMLGARRVGAGHYVDNPASGAVLKKVGFRETGEIRPTHALGRGGEMVLARRYVLELDDAEGELADDAMGNFKPA